VQLANYINIINNRCMFRWILGGVFVFLMLIALTPSGLYAQQSPNFILDEGVIGSSGSNNASSDSYSSSSSTSDISVGNTASGNFQIETGSKTTRDPTLSFKMIDGGSSLGNLSATTASMTTTSFSVLNYTSYGYVVQIFGPPPTNGTETIQSSPIGSSSTPGTDQFGINLVANTLPYTIGSNPDNGQFGFGQASPDYSSPNQYHYTSGDTIALAPKSSGETIYTISYLVNVAALKPGGTYSTSQTIVITGTY